MSIAFTDLASKINKQTKYEVGIVHFFNNLAVIEFNEGTHIDLTSVNTILTDLLDYYGYSKPFGIIANRINSYSISLLDVKEARQALPNLTAYGIVSYNKAGRMSAEIESSFCEWDDICFNNLHDGLDIINKRVSDKTNTILN